MKIFVTPKINNLYDHLNPHEKEIGHGGFGRVYRGTIYHTPCAIKVVRAVGQDVLRKLMPTIRKEVEIMRRNNHPNIVGLLCIAQTRDNNLYLIMPLMAGNLEKFIKENIEKISLLRRLEICQQLLIGLNWLHSQKPPILHLDLKMENVLHDGQGSFKLTDFGLSAILADDVGYVESRLKTPGNVGHMAPEVIQRRKFNEKADVYSMGVLMWEILKGCEWESEVTQQLREMRISGNGGLREVVKRAVCTRGLRPSLEKLPDWPKRLKELLIKMWHLDPLSRPTLSEVLQEKTAISRDLVVQCLERCINDEKGRTFWLDNFSENLDVPAPWADFRKHLYDLFGWAIPPNEKNYQDPSTKRLLYLKLALDAIKSEKVTLQKFGSVVDAFGPLGDGFLENIQNTLSNKWFRPDLSQRGAQEFLSGQEDGTFIVRFSSQPGVPFTISRVKKQKVHQTRIYKKPDGFRIGEEDNARWNNTFFGSLGAIMSNSDVVKSFNLRNFPVLRVVGLAEQLILTPLEDTNYSADGLDLFDSVEHLDIAES